MTRSARTIARLAGTSGLALAFALGALAAPSATVAKGGGKRVVSTVGSCSVASTSKLKAKADNGVLEVEFEVDQNRNNRLWNVKVWDDGVRVFKGQRRTTAPSGSFSLNILIPNRAGTDTLRAKATNVATGETCMATLDY